MANTSTHSNLQGSLDRHLTGRKIQLHALREPVHTFPVNEAHHLRPIMAQMRQARETLPRNKPQMHVGVAGFANLDIAAAERADVILLLDINAHQRTLWEHVIEMLKACPTAKDFRQAFYAKCFESCPEDNKKFSMTFMVEPDALPIRTDGGAMALPPNDRLLLDDLLILQSGMHYDYIRQLAVDGKIACAQADVTDATRMTQLRQWIDKEGMQVASIYASNIQDCMKPDVEEWKLKKMQERLEAEGRPHDISAVLNNPNALVRDPLDDSMDIERVIRPKRGFYDAEPAPLEIGRLANADHTRLYHCSTDNKSPLIVIEGQGACPPEAGKAR